LPIAHYAGGYIEAGLGADAIVRIKRTEWSTHEGVDFARGDIHFTNRPIAVRDEKVSGPIVPKARWSPQSHLGAYPIGITRSAQLSGDEFKVRFPWYMHVTRITGKGKVGNVVGSYVRVPRIAGRGIRRGGRHGGVLTRPRIGLHDGFAFEGLMLTTPSHK
jgi:hypothetical protein